MQAYYKAQDIVPEGEWPAFIECLQKALPVTFRINGCGKFADHLRDRLSSDYFAELANCEVRGGWLVWTVAVSVPVSAG